jgi:para-nitrobenzyl esterase
MDAKSGLRRLAITMLSMASLALDGARAQIRVQIDSGTVEGAECDRSDVRFFKGIPYAAPPVGNLRWREPRPVEPWQGVRRATEFGSRAMQGPIYSDMVFRDAGPSEDCLFLNVWTPAKSAADRLPVMFWIHGGGFEAGSSSEPRQDGENLARKGVVVVSANYRMGVFGFLAHPELTRESGHRASGNYGIMDQIAALRWVRRNIAAFGGDPANVTIFGESAGSFSVSILMTAPSARGLFAKAIAQSGSFFRTRDTDDDRLDLSLGAAEKLGTEFAAAAGAESLAGLRALPAGEILKVQLSRKEFAMESIFDGYVMPRDSYAEWREGRQAHVPLLGGWTADENRAYAVFGSKHVTREGFIASTRAKFGDRADAVLRLYPAGTDAEASRSAGDLAGDQFIAYTTWMLVNRQLATGGSPVYRYSFDRKCPIEAGRIINGAVATGADTGAVHASDIPYAFGNLAGIPGVAWEAADWSLSDAMASYWTNFARTGNPNGGGLPEWPRYARDGSFPVQHLDSTITTAPERHRDRYEYWSADAAAIGQ